MLGAGFEPETCGNWPIIVNVNGMMTLIMLYGLVPNRCKILDIYQMFACAQHLDAPKTSAPNLPDI